MKAVIVAMMLAASGTPWSLADCINHALDNNISVKQSEITVSQRELELNTAKNSMLPSLSANGSQNFSFGRGLTADNTYSNSNTTNTSMSLGTDMPLFRGGSIRHSITLGKLNLEAATADLEKAKDDIRVAVARAYVEILYNMEMLEVAQRQIEIDSLQVERLSAMMEQGKTSSAEVASQKATLGRSRLTATEAENRYYLSILDLTQLLELNSPEGFEIVRPDVNQFEPRLLPRPEDIYASAIEVKPVIKAEQIRLDYAMTNIDKAKSALYPSLSLNGGLGTNFYTNSVSDYKPFGEQLKNNFSQYVGLTLSIPIFSRFSTRNNIKSAKLALHNQSLQLENVRKSLYKEIQQAYYNALASQEKLRSSEAAAASANEAFILEKGKYENGLSTITQFNESKTSLLEAQSNLAQARYEYLFQTRLLDFYQGTALEF